MAILSIWEKNIIIKTFTYILEINNNNIFEEEESNEKKKPVTLSRYG